METGSGSASSSSSSSSSSAMTTATTTTPVVESEGVRARCLAQLKGEVLDGCLQDDSMQLIINTLEAEAVCLSNNTVFLPVQFFSSLNTLESINKAVQRMLRNTRSRMLMGVPRIVGAHFLEETSHWISYETSMPVPVLGVKVCRNLTIFDSLMPPGSSISLPFGAYVPAGSGDPDQADFEYKMLPGEFETFGRLSKGLSAPMILWLVKMLMFLEVYRAYCDGLVTDWDQGPSSYVLRKLPYYLVTIRGHPSQQTAGKMDCGVYALGHLAGIATSAAVVSDDREGTRRLRSFEEAVTSMFAGDSPIIRHIRSAFREEMLPGQFDSGSFLFAPTIGSKVTNPEMHRQRLQMLLRPNYLPSKHQQYAVMKVVEWVFLNLLQPVRIQTSLPATEAAGRYASDDQWAEEPRPHQHKRRLVVHSGVMDITYWTDWLANLVCALGIWEDWEIISFEKFAQLMEFNEQYRFTATPDDPSTLDPWRSPTAIFNFKRGQTPAHDRSHQEGLAILGRYICSNTMSDPSEGTQRVGPITVLNAFLDEVAPAQRPDYCGERDWHVQVYSAARRNGVPASDVPAFFSRETPPPHSTVASSAPSGSRQYLNTRCIDIRAQTFCAPPTTDQNAATTCDVGAFPCRLYATGWDSYHEFRKLDADAAAYAKKRAAKRR